ncbi:LIM domain containing protein [Lotmaria passim]
MDQGAANSPLKPSSPLGTGEADAAAAELNRRTPQGKSNGATSPSSSTVTSPRGATGQDTKAPAAASPQATHDPPHHPEATSTSSPASATSKAKTKAAAKTATATTAPQPGVVAKRGSRSGRESIHEAANRTTAEDTMTGMFTAVSLNAQYKTIPEEHAEFCARNGVRSSYHGPVYTVEDVSVPCHACGGPVDPVTRVPVGSLFFHAGCLQCYLCGRRDGPAGLFVQVDRQAVCSECANRGYERWVPRQEAQSRGMVYGAIQGDVYEAIDAHDRRDGELHRLSGSSQPSRKSAAAPPSVGTAVGAASLNRATVPGALPPSLTIQPVHNARNTGRRSFALMERQQYYTQSDNNLLMRAPESGDAKSGNGGTRRVSKTGKVKRAVAYPEAQRITAAQTDV